MSEQRNKRRDDSQHATGAVYSTHADGCWSWGRKHYDCALRQIDALTRERDQYKLAAELNKQTIEAMSRGEYICSNCGIRKDGEHDHAVEF